MKIYCSGIGGIGLSAYAALQHARGHEVLGSDASTSDITTELERSGITVYPHQDGSTLSSDIDLFVYSEAVPSTSPERVQAENLGIRQISYFAALGELSEGSMVIAVCGTHGKSSTTAMAALALLDAGLDPTVIVGTKIPQMHHRNWRNGASNIFLVEACEYRRSFLHIHPHIVLLTNVDGDHFDAFSSLDEYRDAFADFFQNIHDDGIVIVHGSDQESLALAEQSGKVVLDADVLPQPKLSVFGEHMRQNAQLVSMLGQHLSLDVGPSLERFSGTWRRMELKGKYPLQNSSEVVPVIDDYAHHPSEIIATLSAIRDAYPQKRIVCLFQPHMHDRTYRLYADFLSAFDRADIVVITNVYDARPDVQGEKIHIQQFATDIHTDSLYGGTFSECEHLLRSSLLQQNDVLVVMGAGDVTEVAKRLVDEQ